MGSFVRGSNAVKKNSNFFFSKLGPRLKVVALIDPAVDHAAMVLQKKRDSFVVSAYEKTRIFKTLEDFVSSHNPEESPQCVPL